jgi:translation initiation factor 2D
VIAPRGDEHDDVQYVGLGRLVARGGMRGAWERREKVVKEDLDVEEGKFCNILCIIGDQ